MYGLCLTHCKNSIINLLITGFGFNRVFGSEHGKRLLINFLNTFLPKHHGIRALSYSTENLEHSPTARVDVIDAYCKSKNGDSFIVEIQKANHNFFKNNKNTFYASFPMQERTLKSSDKLKGTTVYCIGVLDFIFSDHKHQHSFIYNHRDVNCNNLGFIYIEIPKFTRTIDQLVTNQEKWLYLLKHLLEMRGQPTPFQALDFLQLFEIARIFSLTSIEEDAYHESLKHFRDFNNIVSTARQEAYEKAYKEALNDVERAEKPWRK